MNSSQRPTTYHLSLLLRSDLDLASVLTEINSAAAKAGSVLADACNPVFLHSASVSVELQEGLS